MKYAVNEAGISALKAMSRAITESMETFSTLLSGVKGVSEGNSQLLGPHHDSLNNAIEEIENNLKQVSEPVNDISEKLNDVAKGYEGVIGNNRYGRS